MNARDRGHLMYKLVVYKLNLFTMQYRQPAPRRTITLKTGKSLQPIHLAPTWKEREAGTCQWQKRSVEREEY